MNMKKIRSFTSYLDTLMQPEKNSKEEQHNLIYSDTY
jgi:hypothetical protein